MHRYFTLKLYFIMNSLLIKLTALLCAFSLLSCNDTDTPQDGYARQSGITPINWIGTYQSKHTCDDCKYEYQQISLHANLTFAIRDYAKGETMNLADTGFIEWIDGKRLKLVGLTDSTRYMIEESTLTKIDSNLVKIDTVTHQFTYSK